MSFVGLSSISADDGSMTDWLLVRLGSITAGGRFICRTWLTSCAPDGVPTAPRP